MINKTPIATPIAIATTPQTTFSAPERDIVL